MPRLCKKELINNVEHVAMNEKILERNHCAFKKAFIKSNTLY
jgi:hypothetical protein